MPNYRLLLIFVGIFWFLFVYGYSTYMPINSTLLKSSLKALGERMAAKHPGASIKVVVVGGSAGLLSGILDAARVTGDCDVMIAEPANLWPELERTAGEVARDLGLPDRWFNRDCAVFAYCLPLGWEERCDHQETYGALQVWTISRSDQIASKIISAPNRPQDLQDLQAMNASREELDIAERAIDRLEAESMDGRKRTDERAILQALRELL